MDNFQRTFHLILFSALFALRTTIFIVLSVELIHITMFYALMAMLPFLSSFLDFSISYASMSDLAIRSVIICAYGATCPSLLIANNYIWDYDKSIYIMALIVKYKIKYKISLTSSFPSHTPSNTPQSHPYNLSTFSPHLQLHPTISSQHSNRLSTLDN